MPLIFGALLFASPATSLPTAAPALTCVGADKNADRIVELPLPKAVRSVSGTLRRSRGRLGNFSLGLLASNSDGAIQVGLRARAMTGMVPAEEGSPYDGPKITGPAWGYRVELFPPVNEFGIASSQAVILVEKFDFRIDFAADGMADIRLDWIVDGEARSLDASASLPGVRPTLLTLSCRNHDFEITDLVIR